VRGRAHECAREGDGVLRGKGKGRAGS
jgi:hypothetical protein